MTPHRVIAALAEIFFHSRTGMANAGTFQQRAAQSKNPVFQRAQADPLHRDVSPQQRRIYKFAAAKRGDDAKVLPLNQRDLAFSAILFSPVVALNTAVLYERRFVHDLDGIAAARSDPNPFNPPRTRKAPHEIAQLLSLLEHSLPVQPFTAVTSTRASL